MIQATARILQNIVEIQVGDDLWTCKPVVTATGALTRRIAALFSTVYETYPASTPNELHSTVSYHIKKDEVLIQVGEQKWRTKSSLFGPMTFEYGGLPFAVYEKLTGRFSVVRGADVVATGELGFRSCQVREYPADLEKFLANLALGFLIRTLVWEMFR